MNFHKCMQEPCNTLPNSYSNKLNVDKHQVMPSLCHQHYPFQQNTLQVLLHSSTYNATYIQASSADTVGTDNRYWQIPFTSAIVCHQFKCVVNFRNKIQCHFSDIKK